MFERLKRLPNKIRASVLKLLPAESLNLFQCSKKGFWDDYFIEAELAIQDQWDKIIWPIIKGFDFDVVLELAPGAGRNTENLSRISKKIYAIDFNEYALEKCKKRFEVSSNGCEINYFLNDGKSFPMVKNKVVSTVYCWDAAVHFDKKVLSQYVKEFKRVLKSGGEGFIHHSNLGEKANKDILNNPGCRSNMSKDIFLSMCNENNLIVLKQVDLPWENYVDCITVFENQD